jgi:DUF1365 family protein
MTAAHLAPALYDAVVVHTRTEPIHRTFRHRICLWLVDLDHLPSLPGWARPFGRIDAADHLGSPDRSIRHNVDSLLAARGIDLAGGRVLMLANARALGHVFNPITLYWCWRGDGGLACVIAEVHNTYGERHCYLLRGDPSGRAEVDKAFYVSPFLEVAGSYAMQVSPPGPRVSVTVDLHQHGRTVFQASLHGTRRPADRRHVVRMMLRRPLASYRVSALIRRHGIALWMRRIRIHPRPQHAPERGNERACP